jgi:hypothetical protein
MGDYQELKSFLGGLDSLCVFDDFDSTVTQFFIIFNFWPIILGYIMFGMTMVKCDYILLLLTSTNFLDNWINYLLRSGIDTHDNYQPVTCPILPEQMPALASQRVVVLYTVMWCLATFIYPVRINKSTIVFLNFSSVLAIYSRMYLGFSTPAQMLAGALVGLMEGLCFTLIFYVLKVHEYDCWIEFLLKYWHSGLNSQNDYS